MNSRPKCCLIGLIPNYRPREYISIHGSILEMTMKEINWEFDKIVEYANIGCFLDMLVKNNSTGIN